MIGSDDDKLLRGWFKNIVDPKKEFESEYAKFMGDKNGQPGNNRRMLAYIAARPDDRQRLIVQHAWQIHDHCCNTRRADAQARSMHIATVMAIGFAGLGAALTAGYGWLSNLQNVAVLFAALVGVTLTLVAIGVALRYRVKKSDIWRVITRK